MKRRQFLQFSALAATTPLGALAAETYPTKPVRLIVPFAPGGSTDVIARLISDPLYKALGQPFVVENKAGAGGAVGTMDVVKAAPDGYTLLVSTMSVTAANPAINPNNPYDPVTDLVPIMSMAASPSVLAVNPSFPARTYKEFIAEVKKRPDHYTYGTPGVGGIVHLLMEYFCGLAGISLRHVPFKGAGPALTAGIAGHVDMVYDTPPSLMPFVRSGKLIPLVVSSPERWKDIPDVPTFREVGLDKMTRMPDFGLLGPKGLPRDIVLQLNGALKKILQEPSMRTRIDEAGAVVIASTPEAFAADIKSLYLELKQVVADRKLKME